MWIKATEICLLFAKIQTSITPCNIQNSKKKLFILIFYAEGAFQWYYSQICMMNISIGQKWLNKKNPFEYIIPTPPPPQQMNPVNRYWRLGSIVKVYFCILSKSWLSTRAKERYLSQWGTALFITTESGKVGCYLFFSLIRFERRKLIFKSLLSFYKLVGSL